MWFIICEMNKPNSKRKVDEILKFEERISHCIEGYWEKIKIKPTVPTRFSRLHSPASHFRLEPWLLFPWDQLGVAPSFLRVVKEMKGKKKGEWSRVEIEENHFQVISLQFQCKVPRTSRRFCLSKSSSCILVCSISSQTASASALRFESLTAIRLTMSSFEWCSTARTGMK